MSEKTITLTKRQLKKIIQAEIEKDRKKPIVATFSISKYVADNRKRIEEWFETHPIDTKFNRVI